MSTGLKNLILAGIAMLMLLGVAVAFANLPVVTGCGYYGRCGVEMVTD